MRRRDSLVIRILALSLLTALLFFVGMQVYNRFRLVNHFQKLDEQVAVEYLNRTLDLIQAEVRNIQIIARSLEISEEQSDLDFPRMMNLLNLDFLLVIGAETRGKEVRGMVRQDGGFDRITDGSRYFKDNLRGPFSGDQVSSWGFLISEKSSEMYLLCTKTERPEGLRYILGRKLSPAMSYYIRRSEDLSIGFSAGPTFEEGALRSPKVGLEQYLNNTPMFHRVSRDEVDFRISESGRLQMELTVDVPYLDTGLLITLATKTSVRETGQREMAILNIIYLTTYLLYLGSLVFWLIYGLSMPLDKLISGVETWDGFRIPDMGGTEERGDELGLLAKTFLQMSGDIIAKTRSLEEQAVRDGLTGLFNRRRFDESFKSEWERHRRKNLELSIVMADIDYFKDFNDTYGHPEGDRCLHLVAGACMKALKRPGDMAFRYGGEEFAFILPDTGEEGARNVAERIRLSVLDTGSKSRDGGVSLSLGVACCSPAADGNRGRLLRAADQALYQAKQQGRNRVVVGSVTQTYSGINRESSGETGKLV